MVYEQSNSINNVWMFGFIKKMSSIAIGFIGLNVNAIPLKCVSMNNQECRVRPKILNINSNK